MTELHELTAMAQLDHLRRGTVSPGELTDHYLERIARLDPELGAFATITPDRARGRIEELDSISHAATLWGLPIADKDLVDRAGVPSGYGSRAFAGYVPDSSDELVDVLDRAGAVSLGKTAAPEFGLPSYTEPLTGRPARNPYDRALGAGGSSGGAAVAVAAGLLPFAPGSDGGGSIRIPAAACGLVGLKPSRGRIPAGTGFASLGGLVVPGPLARTVADAALLLDALADGGVTFSATIAPDSGGAFLDSAVRGEGRFQVGVTTDSPWSGAYDLSLAPDARAALDLAIAELDAIGHGIEEVRIEDLASEGTLDYADAFRTIWQAGAAGIPIEGARLELVEPLTRWLIEVGRTLPAQELGRALNWLAEFERRVIRRRGAHAGARPYAAAGRLVRRRGS